jgi:hypothetical protein
LISPESSPNSLLNLMVYFPVSPRLETGTANLALSSSFSWLIWNVQWIKHTQSCKLFDDVWQQSKLWSSLYYKIS